MTLNASNAQNSDGLTDVNFNYSAITGTTQATFAHPSQSIGSICSRAYTRYKSVGLATLVVEHLLQLLIKKKLEQVLLAIT